MDNVRERDAALGWAVRPVDSTAATNACCCLEEDPDGRRCEAVASILVTCPQQSASAESYYTTVCPQVRTQTCLWLSLLPLNA